MDDLIINELDGQIANVNHKANYWLIRTDGGTLYNVFCSKKIVAIGYKDITVNDVETIEKKETEQSSRDNALQSLVESKYPNKSRPGYIASMISRFFWEIKKDDIVIIPDESANKMRIGVFTDDIVKNQPVYRKRRNVEHLDDDFFKVRTVDWLKEVPRQFINPNLYKIFYSHQTVVLANEYSQYVNSMLYDFYRSAEQYHLVFDISNLKVPAFQLFRLYYELLTFSKKFADKYVNEVIDLDEVELSINLNSPGKLELAAKTGKTLFIVGAILVFVNGGGFKFECKAIGLESNISTQGVIAQINTFMNSSEDRDMKNELEAALKKIQISNPKDLVSILEAVNRKNQNE